MLKPPNEPEPMPGDNDRPVGELVHELIEDGKAYARAEVSLVKAIAAAKANALKLPAILFGVAFLLVARGDHRFGGRRCDGPRDPDRAAGRRDRGLPAVCGNCRRPRLVWRRSA